MIQCARSGTAGFFLSCGDATCSSVTSRTPFRAGECLPNPAQYGSRSVVFRCGAGSVPDAEVDAAIAGLPMGPAPQGIRGASGAFEVTAAGVTIAVGAVTAARLIN